MHRVAETLKQNWATTTRFNSTPHRAAAKIILSYRMRRPVCYFSFLAAAVFLFAPRLALCAVTFDKQIAPIIWNHCAPCHHSGQSAPFELISFSDVARHGKQILKAIESDYMPPWPPARGYVEFQNERRLSVAERKFLQQWLAEGSLEGDPKDLPPLPQWKEGWALGKPDLVVTMPKAFQFGAEGADVYRNFVIPIEMDRDRYVRAVEFVPGNARIVHHAFVKVDTNATCRLLDGRDGSPGFYGMNISAEMPGGQFLTWQPGKLPAPAPDSFAWLLPKKSDLVLQVHMNRTGKAETLQSSVGLYFTDVVPTNRAFKMQLVSFNLHFPPGESNAVITDSFTLPVDVEALAVLPHAHYLAREMQGYAILPDGKKQWLIFIKDWDFRWQGDYRYSHPLQLPAGTTLHLQYTYDNSTNNLRNPNNPPRLVSYGSQSSDEMCELWLQLLPKSPRDYATLQRAYEDHLKRTFLEFYKFLLKWDPNDLRAITSLGVAMMAEGKISQATSNFRRAVEIDPNYAAAHYELGVLYRLTHRPGESRRELEIAVHLNPENPKAWGHLGFVYAELGNAEQAGICLRKSLQLDPSDRIIQEALDELSAQTRR